MTDIYLNINLFTVYVHLKFHTPKSKGLSVFTTKAKTEIKFHKTDMSLLYILQKLLLNTEDNVKCQWRVLKLSEGCGVPTSEVRASATLLMAAEIIIKLYIVVACIGESHIPRT